jgi:hypothetical protein
MRQAIKNFYAIKKKVPTFETALSTLREKKLIFQKGNIFFEEH